MYKQDFNNDSIEDETYDNNNTEYNDDETDFDRTVGGNSIITRNSP